MDRLCGANIDHGCEEGTRAGATFIRRARRAARVSGLCPRRAIVAIVRPRGAFLFAQIL